MVVLAGVVAPASPATGGVAVEHPAAPVPSNNSSGGGGGGGSSSCPQTGTVTYVVTPANASGFLPLTVMWNVSLLNSTAPYNGSVDFGDYTTSGFGEGTDLLFHETYETPGNFTARFEFTDSSHPCHSYRFSTAVHVSARGPVGSISVSPGNVSGPAPLVTTFHANVAGVTNYSVFWQSSFGAQGVGSSFTCTFPQNGTYLVQAYLSDPAGVNLTWASANVTVTGPSVLTLSSTPIEGLNPLRVTYRATFNDTAWLPAHYVVDWGMYDGTQLLGTVVNYTYAVPPPWGGGLVTVNAGLFAAANVSGTWQPVGPELASAATVTTIYPNGTGEDGIPYPLVYMDVARHWGTAPFSTTINVSGYGGATPYTLSLCNFGGVCWYNISGWNGSTLHLSHTWSAPGAYGFWPAMLDAKGRVGATSVDGIQVNSTTPLNASVTGGPDRGSAPLTVTYGASVAGGTPPYSYVWTFGDGGTLVTEGNEAARHTYTAPGAFDVRVTVLDANGMSLPLSVGSVAVTAAQPSGSTGGPQAPNPGPNEPRGALPWLKLVVVPGAAAGLFAGYLMVARYRVSRREGEVLVHALELDAGKPPDAPER